MKTFNNFAAFAVHLAGIWEVNKIETERSLEKAAKYLEKKIKSRFGNYIREDVGKFKEWAELASSTKADRVRKGFPENEPLLRTGELRDSVKSEVKGYEAFVGSTSQIMVWQEHGTSRIPARSVFGAEAFMAKDKILAIIGMAAISRLTGKQHKVEI